jgi:hypothetical protein
MDSARFSRGEFAFLIGVPLAWAVLLLFHPTGEDDDIYAGLRDDVTPWLVVHVGTMLFIPLLAMAIYLLVRGIENTAARVCRIALVTFVLFYTAWEVLMGIGTGVLVQEVNGLAAAERATGSNLVNDFTDNILVRDFGIFNIIGSASLITATIAAGIALRHQAGVPLSVPILLGLCGFMIAAHPPPFGPLGLVLFIAAVLLYARSQATARTHAPLAQPHPT